MSNVAINIAAQFVGKAAFKTAETSVDKLNKSTKALGKTLTRTLGTTAVVAFGKASVKAFAEDNKAATSLGITLKNLDLAYGSNIGTVNGFINRLESQTGVLDDELRPAMDRLLRATGSVTKAQELLGLALDVAAGTGKSVTQVSQSLQKAYLGQTQALGRLGVGLSRAELTSSSFEEIQQRLTVLFAGQASAAAETFAGQLDKLTIAANNAKETIGQGLYDGISALSGGGATAATDNIDKLARGIGDTLANVGSLINKLKDLKPVLIGLGVVAAAAFLPMTTAIVGAIFLLGQLNKALDKSLFKQGIVPGGMGNISMTVSGKVDNSAAKTAQTAQTKAAKDTAKAQKESLKLAKARATFDLQKIQIEAALKGKISAEDEIRLKLMKAILNENLTDVEKYQKALEKAQEESKKLADALAAIKASEAANPFAKWAGYVKEAIDLTNSVAMASLQAGLAAGAKLSEALSGARYAAQGAAASAAAADAAAIAGAYGSATTAAAAQAKAAQEAAAAQLAAITAGSKAQQEALAAQIKAQQEALEAQGAAALAALKKRLAEEKAALDEAAAERTATVGTETLVKIIAGSAAGSAEAQAAAATAAAIAAAEQAAQLAAINAASAAAIAAAEAAAERGSTGAPTQIAVTITGDPFTDPNAVAEKVVEIIRSAANRGTVDVLGFG
jgi:hypothetical protein